MARPAIKITEQQIEQAKTLAGYGLTDQQIATILDIGYTTLRNKPELMAAIKKGKEIAAGNLHKTAYEMAVKDRNPAMVMFMLKCKHGWRERQELDITHGFKPMVIHKRDGSRIELTMGNKNDTEDEDDDKSTP